MAKLPNQKATNLSKISLELTVERRKLEDDLFMTQLVQAFRKRNEEQAQNQRRSNESKENEIEKQQKAEITFNNCLNANLNPKIDFLIKMNDYLLRCEEKNSSKIYEFQIKATLKYF